MRFERVLVVAPLLLILILTGAASSQETGKCLACHSAMKGKLKIHSGALIELNVDLDKFNASAHKSLACTDCHIRFSDNPHVSPGSAVPPEIVSLSSKIAAKHTTDPIAAAACMSCHEETYTKVLGSVHGRNIVEKNQTDGALCVDCHGSPHYIRPAKDPESAVGRKNQVKTCGKCHGDPRIIEKYKLEENVMDSFNESFHGRKLLLGHTRAPVCASCHGSHDILKKDDPKSPVFGANKLTTCGKCHKGANEKFVPAITHKRPGPIPHYAEKALILLTMGTFAFIVLHVLLEAFSDIRDAIFRKTEEHK
ncbi:MAG: hypothetical protein OHK006_19570 [Thermodesulfovibrionales bacterium]